MSTTTTTTPTEPIVRVQLELNSLTGTWVVVSSDESTTPIDSTAAVATAEPNPNPTQNKCEYVKVTTYSRDTKAIISEICYEPLTERCHGPYNTWFVDKNGVTESRKCMGNYHHGQKHGSFITWEPSTDPAKPYVQRSIENYQYGRLHGQFADYHSNGLIRTDCYYSNGERHGKSMTFYENGRVKIESLYHYNRLEGECKEHLDDGPVLRIDNFTNGRYDGECILFYPGTTQVKHRMTYVMGERQGPHFQYFLGGRLETNGTFLRDEKVGKWIERDEDGNEILVKDYGSRVVQRGGGSLAQSNAFITIESIVADKK